MVVTLTPSHDGVNGYGVRIAYQSTDFVSAPPTSSPTAASTGASTAAASTSISAAPPPSKLSTGAAVGIGIGVGVVAFALLGAGVYFYMRRRATRASPGVGAAGNYDQTEQPKSGLEGYWTPLPRTPVPKVYELAEPSNTFEMDGNER
jgi:hypothetical protein